MENVDATPVGPTSVGLYGALELIENSYYAPGITVSAYIPEGWDDGCRVKGDFDTTSVPLMAVTGDGGI